MRAAKTVMSASQNTTSKNRMRSGTSSLKPVSQILRPVIKEILPQKSLIFQQIFDLWNEIVLGTEAANSIPEKLTFTRNQQKEASLSLWAQSGAQATEITYNKTAIIRRINSVFGYALVADIRVTAHPNLLNRPIATQGKINTKVNPNRGVPSQSLDKMLGDISNPSLKTILNELGSVLDPQITENKDSKGENNE